MRLRHVVSLAVVAGSTLSLAGPAQAWQRIATYGPSQGVAQLTGGYGYAAWTTGNEKRTTLTIRKSNGTLRRVRLAGAYNGSISIMRSPATAGKSRTVIVGSRCAKLFDAEGCRLDVIRADTGRRIASGPMAAQLGSEDGGSIRAATVEGDRTVRLDDTCTGTMTDTTTGQVTPLPSLPDCYAPSGLTLRGSRLVMNTSVASSSYDYHSGVKQYILDLSAPTLTWTPLGGAEHGRASSLGSVAAVLLGDSVFDLHRQMDGLPDGTRLSETTSIRRWTLTSAVSGPSVLESRSDRWLDGFVSTDRELIGLERQGDGRSTRIVRIPVGSTD